jgi:hypothetical protein
LPELTPIIDSKVALEQNQIKTADEAMDNSVSNIQLTPEAKRIIEGEIAYQTSGQGFWLGVFVYGVIIFVSSLFLLGGIVLCLGAAWHGNLWGLALGSVLGFFMIIPIMLFGYVRRAVTNRQG